MSFRQIRATTLVLLASFLILPASHCSENILTEQVREILTEATSLKPGHTRADLQKYFTAEAGLSTPVQRTYVSKRCPYIKIDVQFRPVKTRKQSPGDVIQGISKPYLAMTIVD